VGLAFQIVDDILDATEGPDQLGKTAGKDAAAEKATYVRIHGLERSRALARELLDEALEALSFGRRRCCRAGPASSSKRRAWGGLAGGSASTHPVSGAGPLGRRGQGRRQGSCAWMASR
jgi:hypothetical protein